jgi:2-oxoglutarate dehydrogenase E2 component (dihydrolipoamide succinyltransferase)
VLTEILKGDGQVALAGEVLARIDTEATATIAATAPFAPATPAPATPALPQTTAAPRTGPAVRRLLAEHEIPATQVPTGGDGRLHKGDVLRYLEGTATATIAATAPFAPATPAPATAARSAFAPDAAARTQGARGERREPMSRLRQRVAERLLAAQRDNAILTTFNEVNLTAIQGIRNHHQAEFERQHGVRLGYLPFFIQAVCAALRHVPAVNAAIDGTDIVHHDYIDMGIAVSTPRGLVVPVLRNADLLSFADIERAIRGFAERAQAGALTLEEMTGGTFTITNGGTFGSLLSTPIINPPQSGILGMHKIQDRPVAESGQVVIRPMMYIALSYDHRIIDGREAVQFLVAVKDALEDPARLLLAL